MAGRLVFARQRLSGSGDSAGRSLRGAAVADGDLDGAADASHMAPAGLAARALEGLAARARGAHMSISLQLNIRTSGNAVHAEHPGWFPRIFASAGYENVAHWVEPGSPFHTAGEPWSSTCASSGMASAGASESAACASRCCRLVDVSTYRPSGHWHEQRRSGASIRAGVGSPRNH
jgi:hypothetical protein